MNIYLSNEKQQEDTFTTNLNESSDDALVDYIHDLLFFAIKKNASDIHFEPYHQHYRFRLRIEGILTALPLAEPSLGKRIAARLKIMANLDITEIWLPQDGQIQVTLNKKIFHLRISTCPTIFGEKIVLRILYHEKHRDISTLGLSHKEKNQLINAIEKPQGLILVCGPTGSGKTTTLYAALKHLNSQEKNIVTVENPVEIQIPGINQVNANNKKLSFQKALRTFLRQDPDIIMVGEIRDQETAKTAIKAAQTGHLVLSTLHSNTPLKALHRLRSMGIPSYDLSDSITLIISQRLLRKLCESCKISTKLDTDIINTLKLPTHALIYKAVGCEKCRRGYCGRFAIYEFSTHPHTSDNNENLKAQAIQYIKTGSTSFEEIKRVIEL